jgi:ribosomal protein L37AE/L43A
MAWPDLPSLVPVGDFCQCRFCGNRRTTLVGVESVWVCRECAKIMTATFARKGKTGNMQYLDKS